MTGVVVGVSEARGEPIDQANVNQIVVEYEDALDELTPEEQQVFFEELDLSVGGDLAVITEKARYDVMNTALFVLGVFVLLALVAAVFLPKGKLADGRHPPDPDAERFDKRAPYPERGT